MWMSTVCRHSRNGVASSNESANSPADSQALARVYSNEKEKGRRDARKCVQSIGRQTLEKKNNKQPQHTTAWMLQQLCLPVVVVLVFWCIARVCLFFPVRHSKERETNGVCASVSFLCIKEREKKRNMEREGKRVCASKKK